VSSLLKNKVRGRESHQKSTVSNTAIMAKETQQVKTFSGRRVEVKNTNTGHKQKRGPTELACGKHDHLHARGQGRGVKDARINDRCAHRMHGGVRAFQDWSQKARGAARQVLGKGLALQSEKNKVQRDFVGARKKAFRRKYDLNSTVQK